MSEHTPGQFDQPAPVNGPKFVVGVIVGLIIFMFASLAITFYGGRWAGNALNKKALENERQIQMERLREHEAGKK